MVFMVVKGMGRLRFLGRMLDLLILVILQPNFAADQRGYLKSKLLRQTPDCSDVVQRLRQGTCVHRVHQGSDMLGFGARNNDYQGLFRTVFLNIPK